MGSLYYLPDNFVGVFLCSCNHDVKDCKIIPLFKKNFSNGRLSLGLPFQLSDLYRIV